MGGAELGAHRKEGSSSSITGAEQGIHGCQHVCVPEDQPALTKELNVYFLKGVVTAELVELMVDLVEDEGLVVVGCVVPHDVINWQRKK